MQSTLTFPAHFRPDEVKVWKHIPFEVPEGVRQFHISIDYNDRIDSNPLLAGGNTLDVGLFDPQGIESGSPGLRGWSGSVRTEITIDEDWATPPYRAGAIQPGEWNLLLGAYKTSPNGLTVNVSVTFNSNHPAPNIPPLPELADLQRASLPAPAEPHWYRGDLHMHTVYSDGDSYPHELAAHAYSIGLDFYGITDHNRAQSPVPLVPHGNGWPVLVPGVEVTSYAGHFNVWGGPDTWYDFRDYSASGQQAAVNAARANGALVSLNHPKPYGPMWEHPEVTGFECIEPWNGWYGALNNIAIGYWADALEGDTPESWHVGVGGSDMHKLKTPGVPGIPVSPATMGYPTLWIRTPDPLSPESIIAAIRAGNCFISESPSGPQLYVHRDGNEIAARVVGAEGDVLVAVDGGRCIRADAIHGTDTSFHWPIEDLIPAGARFVRFELHTPGGGIRALSNPIWK